jgi:hypothetical protein
MEEEITINKNDIFDDFLIQDNYQFEKDMQIEKM